jgi:hypothetical protein
MLEVPWPTVLDVPWPTVLEVPWPTVLDTVVKLREICQRDEQLVNGGGGRTSGGIVWHDSVLCGSIKCGEFLD